MRRLLSIACGMAFLLFAGCAAMTGEATGDEQLLNTPESTEGPSMQKSESFKGVITKHVTCNYLLFLPKGYRKSDARWPLILFLHGSGERGDDLALVKRHGPPKLVDANPDFPFILVSPQCPGYERWDTDMLAALLDDIQRRYAVDPDRVYLTGLSMGGYGTWKLAMEHPERFAAIAPICGGGDPKQVDRLKNVPVWAFHGARDPVVPYEESEALVDALRKAEGDVRFTLYPDATHNSWTRTYRNQALYDWFLQHKRGRGSTAEGQ